VGVRGGILLLLAATAALAAGPASREALLDPSRASGSARRTLFGVQLLRAEGRWDEARTTLREHLRRNPEQDHALLHFNLGQILAQVDSLDAARAEFARAVELEPDLWPAWRNRAEVAYGLGLHAEAAAAFGRAWELDPAGDVRLRYYQGVALLQAGRAGEATDVLADLLAEPPAEAEIAWYRALVSAAVDAGAPARANPAMTDLITRYPTDPEAWYLAYQQAAAAVDYPRAVRNLTVVGFLRPLTLDERRQLGDLCLAAGVPARAARHFSAVLDSTPRPRADDLDRLITAQLAADRPDEALAVLDRRLAAAPSARFWRLKGELLYGQGSYAGAQEAFAAAAALDPDNREFDLLQGYCLVEMGETGRARGFLRRAAGDPRWASRANEALAYLESLRESEEAAGAGP
jgi:tetratricopeptide (TPR) repeat protein